MKLQSLLIGMRLWVAEISRTLGLSTILIAPVLLVGYPVSEHSISLNLLLPGCLILVLTAVIFFRPGTAADPRYDGGDDLDPPARKGQGVPASGGPPVLVGAAAKSLPTEDEEDS